jgi:hypothetical protein
MTDLQRKVLRRLNSQVNNGGFHQWWWNGYYKDHIEMLRTINHEQLQAFLDDFEQIYNDYDFDDDSEWQCFLDALEELDDDFYDSNLYKQLNGEGDYHEIF